MDYALNIVNFLFYYKGTMMLTSSLIPMRQNLLLVIQFTNQNETKSTIGYVFTLECEMVGNEVNQLKNFLENIQLGMKYCEDETIFIDYVKLE